MSTHSSERSELVRGLGLLAATAVVIGDTIGSGIFLVSSEMARTVGSTTLVFVAWILGGVIVLFGAFCYAELGAMFPKAGGPYIYLSRGLGPLWGFLFGWMSAFLDRPVAMATLAAGFLRFLGFLLPAVSTPLFTVHIAGSEFAFTAAQPLAAVVVILVTALNYLSVKFSGAIQVVLTSLKIGTILLIVFAGLFLGSKHAIDSTLILNTVTPRTSLFVTIGAILFAVAALYLLANVVYFRTLPFPSIASSQHIASDVVNAVAGPGGASWLTVAMAISALGALHVVVLTGARIPYAMARDGIFFRFAAEIHPRLRTPSGSLVFLGSIASLLALTGTYEQLYSLFVFAAWIFFALTAIALLRLRKKEPGFVRPYRAWGFPFTPIIFVIAALALTINLWLVRPLRSSIGLLVILAGIPFFYWWRKHAVPPGNNL